MVTSTNDDSNARELVSNSNRISRRHIMKTGMAFAGVLGVGVGPNSANATTTVGEPHEMFAAGGASEFVSGTLDPVAEAKKIAFDRKGNGEPVLLISGFPQTRRSWNRMIPLLAPKFQAIPADLPSFGDWGTSRRRRLPKTWQEFSMSLYSNSECRCTLWLTTSAHGARTAGHSFSPVT